MTEEEKRAPLEGVRGEVFERALSEAQHDREAAMLRRARVEARAELDRLRALLDRLDATEVDHAADAASWLEQCEMAREDLSRVTRERDEAIARAERAEAQLAALRKASVVFPALHRHVSENSAVVPLSAEQWADFCAAVADCKAAAEAHDRRVRAEALRDAAACLREHAEAMASGDRRAGVFAAVGMIGARAYEIERGER